MRWRAYRFFAAFSWSTQSMNGVLSSGIIYVVKHVLQWKDVPVG
ncbi:hypothetical protein [uncultured Bartonella sp.]|nr:hypothetical protein [uncultured Bartonella sp.]